MSRSIAGSFVQSLKEKISEEKSQTKKKRIHLQDSLNIIIELFKTNSNLEIRSIRDFETSEVTCFVDVYSPDDIFDTISLALVKSNILHTKEILHDYKCVFVIDLEDKIISSGELHNTFYIEVFSKRLKTYKLKISPCDPKFSYSVFDKGYHEIKYWYHDNMEIKKVFTSLRGLDRDKKKAKIISDENGHEIIIEFNDLGEAESFNLFNKKGRKTKN